MTVTPTTHLNFRGNAREALEFYRSVVGGDLTIMTYGDMGAADVDSEALQVMWGQVAAGNGFRVMAYGMLTDRFGTTWTLDIAAYPG